MKSIILNLEHEEKIKVDDDITPHEILVTWDYLTEIIINNSSAKDLTAQNLIDIVKIRCSLEKYK